METVQYDVKAPAPVSKVRAIEPQTSKFNRTYYGLRVKVDDQVNILDVFKALDDYDPKKVQRALDNVGIDVVIRSEGSGRYMMYGSVTTAYKQYLEFKKPNDGSKL